MPRHRGATCAHSDIGIDPDDPTENMLGFLVDIINTYDADHSRIQDEAERYVGAAAPDFGFTYCPRCQNVFRDLDEERE